MSEVTLTELEKRWQRTLAATQAAVARQPCVYRELKSLAGEILVNPLDIADYLPTAQRLVALLERMETDGRGSIFGYFSKRISPASIYQVPLLRMECKDLLAHLTAFDRWRVRKRRLHVVHCETQH